MCHVSSRSPAALLAILLLTTLLSLPACCETQPSSDAAEKPAPPAPPVSFYGLQTSGHRIIYVIDHSESLLDNYDFLKQDLTKSVIGLSHDQSVSIVFFGDTTESVFPMLRPATPEAKRELVERIARTRATGTNGCPYPLVAFQAGFKQAFALKPDTIFFLTDGFYLTDGPALADVIKKLNTSHAVHIHTLAFINKDPRYEAQLQQIAKDNAGQYKFVSERDLGK